MRRTAVALIGLASLFGLASRVQAAQQVGTVVASQPFELRGVRVTPTGVPSWPVSAGDEVATENGPVTFQFPDGSQIALEPNSRARIEGTRKSPVFRLIECTADYRLKRLSSVSLYRKDQAEAERISKVEGQYTVGCRAGTEAPATGGATGAAATSGVASAGVSGAGAASAGAASAGIATAAVTATAAAVAGVATSVGIVGANNAGTPPPLSTP